MDVLTVRALQRRVGVTADGAFGPDTLAAVVALLDRLQKPAPAPAIATPASVAPVLVVPALGPRAIALLHHFESCRLAAYLCPGKVWTIGWGNTWYADGSPVKQGDTITQVAADELFMAVLRIFRAEVANVVPSATTSQFGAMAALAYNIGMGWPFGRAKRPGEKKGFRQSGVLRFHRAGEFDEAAAAFAGWNIAGGRVSKGLVRRRAAEALLYRADFAAFDKAIGYRP